MKTSLVFVVGAAMIGLAQRPSLFTADSGISEMEKKGAVEFNSAAGEYRVSGAGGDIWGASDGFHFVWKRVSGDLAVTADAQFVGVGAMSHRKAALMFRQSLEPDSPFADAVLHGDGLTALQFRPTVGAMSQNLVVVAKSDLSTPVRLRIERVGDKFTVMAGTSRQSTTLKMQDPVYVGLAVSSHNPDVLETALFKDVTIEPIAVALPLQVEGK